MLAKWSSIVFHLRLCIDISSLVIGIGGIGRQVNSNENTPNSKVAVQSVDLEKDPWTQIPQVLLISPVNA